MFVTLTARTAFEQLSVLVHVGTAQLSNAHRT